MRQFAVRVVSLGWLTATMLFLASPLCAETYFVAQNGKEGNPGTKELPLATLQAAVDRLRPGDECVVLPGVYGEAVRLSKSGSPGQPIAIRA